ncbi:MAG TPA: prepilin-type N-terminal cleavage/methylation domain-containing protein [Planctomycetota bacterium]|nr:prepilin-type N-terminal cleavage/methylation domain-containing protein [Planctomycetota bacterium]
MDYMSATTRKAARQGFTLIELLVVIAIIAILAAIIIPAVMAVQGQAQKSKDLEQVRGMGNAMTLYYKKYAFFPCYGNMSDPAITTITLARATEPKKGLSMKLLMSGGFAEDAKTFFCPRDAAPTANTLTQMQKELDPKKPGGDVWATTYAYDAGHNPNHGAIPFFGNRLAMLVPLSYDTCHVLTCEQVAKELEVDPTTKANYYISNHKSGDTASTNDDIYVAEDGTFGWRDSALVEPPKTDIP